MTILNLAEALAENASIVIGVLGLFGFGRAPDLDTPLDAEETAATLRLGIDDLCDADRRSGGWSRINPNIAIEDVILAARMEEALAHGVDLHKRRQ